MSIHWSKVKARLAVDDEALSRAACPGLETVRKVYRKRMLQLADRPVERSVFGQAESVLVFVLCGERYGVEAAEITRVLRLANVTPITGLLDGVLGVTAWQDEVRTIMCLSQLLGLRQVDGVQRGDYVLVPRRWNGQVLLRVDAAEQITSVSRDSVVPLDHDSGASNACLRGRSCDGITLVDMAVLAGQFDRTDSFRAASPD